MSMDAAAAVGGIRSSRTPGTAADDPGPGPTAAVAEQPADQPPPPPPLLTYIGVGEAGWGCPGAAQSFRGCRWTARAGLVLRLPDHARLRQQGQTGAAVTGASEGDRGGPTVLPLCLFRSWGLQLEGQGQGRALKGLSKVDWPNFGFALMGAPQSGAGEEGQGRGGCRRAGWCGRVGGRSPMPLLCLLPRTPASPAVYWLSLTCHALPGPCADGTLTATLRCAQPASGARLEAAVVHLVPCEHRGAAESGKPPALSAGYEVGG